MDSLTMHERCLEEMERVALQRNNQRLKELLELGRERGDALTLEEWVEALTILGQETPEERYQRIKSAISNLYASGYQSRADWLRDLHEADRARNPYRRFTDWLPTLVLHIERGIYEAPTIFLVIAVLYFLLTLLYVIAMKVSG